MSDDVVKIGLEVTANTQAAVGEVTKLNKVLTDSVDAAESAGKGQKTLGQEISKTKAQQVVAAEALRKLKDAQQEHNLTVAAFGPKSREAAESAKKLSAATEELRKTSAEAAKALEEVAKRTTEAAKAEGDKLTPATKRAAAEIAKMGKAAEASAGDIRRMELQAGKGGKGFDVMGMAGSKLMGVLGPAALGGSLLALAGWIGDASEGALQFETAINNLPFSIEGAKVATQGLVSEQMLVSAASSATSLGVTRTAADFEKLAAASVKLAAKLGQPADQLLNNLVTALGRGSTELLDNAGIVLKVSEAHERYADSIGKTVSQLSDEEKAGAFKSEAFKAITEAADKTTVAYDSNAASVVRLKVASQDSWASIKRDVVDATGAIGQGFDDMLVGATNLFGTTWIRDSVWDAKVAVGAWAIATNEAAKNTAAWGAELVLGKQVLDMINGVTTDPDNIAKAKALYDIEHEKNRVLGEEADFLERQQKALEKINKQQEEFLDAQAMHSVVYGPEEAPKKKKGKKTKKTESFDNLDRFADQTTGVQASNQIASDRQDMDVSTAYAQEIALREQKLDLMARELELVDAQAEQASFQQDAVFFLIDVESEAEQRREEMLRARMDRELELAEFERDNALSEEERLRGTSRVAEVEHKKQLAGLQAFAKLEAKEQAKRQAIYEKVSGRVSELSGVMVDAVWEQAEGQKGAILMMLGDYLKGVSKEMTIKALVETAKGAAALAGVYTAGLAPGHFAAAGLAAGVAVAAGGAGVALSNAGKGKAADQKAAEDKKSEEAKADEKELQGLQKGAKDPVTKREGKDLSHQEVPVSYDERRRGDASIRPKGPSTVILQLTVQGNVIGAGGVKELGQYLTKVLNDTQSSGRVY